MTGRYTYAEVGHAQTGDYRHILPVEPLRGPDEVIAHIHAHNAQVDARLRKSMKTMGRMWSLDHLADAIEHLRAAIAAGEDLSHPHTRAQRHERFFVEVREAISNAIWEQVQRHVQGAELERLLVPILEAVYGGDAKVEAVGGPGEKGADIMISAADSRGVRFRTAIQVKMHDGVTGDERCLDQLRRAHTERKAQAAVLLTTAVALTPALEQALGELKEELEIDIKAWTREDFVELLLGYLYESKREG